MTTIARIFWMIAATLAVLAPSLAEPGHGLALYGPGDLKYGPDDPYAFANLNAPKGGTLRLSTVGAFTKINAFSLKGFPPPSIGLVFETLMEGSLDADESFSQYGLLAETAEIAPDRMSITYRLHGAARFSDGQPVTADDVVFSFNIIHDPEFRPFYRAYYANVKQAVKIDDRTVRFEFSETNPELPLIMGQLTILPKHIYGVEGKQFGSDFDEVAVGSGPYVVDDYDYSTHITYRRNPDHWGRGLPRNRGRYNFDQITYKVFLDPIPAREALKGDLVDADMITSSKDWALSFDGKFVQNGYLVKQGFPHERVEGMQCFVFNLRRPLFQDRQLRKVLASMFDFEYCNQNLFFGQYIRALCFWENNPELYSRGPATGNVRRTLIQLRREFGDPYVPADAIRRGPYNAGDRLDGTPYDITDRIRTANQQLDAMGWTYHREAGVRQKEGQDLRFELTITSAGWTRIVNPLIENLRELGIRAGYRLVQPAEFINRVQEHRYDSILTAFPQSESPGNEQRDFWTSEAADVPGSRNTPGIQNPAVDRAVEAVIAATSRKELVEAVQVLDRILCANHYVIPNWYINYDRGVYWNRFGRPDTYISKANFLGNVLQWWWYDNDQAQRLEAARKDDRPL